MKLCHCAIVAVGAKLEDAVLADPKNIGAVSAGNTGPESEGSSPPTTVPLFSTRPVGSSPIIKSLRKMNAYRGKKLFRLPFLVGTMVYEELTASGTERGTKCPAPSKSA